MQKFDTLWKQSNAAEAREEGRGVGRRGKYVQVDEGGKPRERRVSMRARCDWMKKFEGALEILDGEKMVALLVHGGGRSGRR